MVLIGIDPHKGSHTAVAIDGHENQLGELRLRSSAQQCVQLLEWASPFPERRWAIESAGGLGYLLAQQLVAAGEDVVDVPPTLSSRVRVLEDPLDVLAATEPRPFRTAIRRFRRCRQDAAEGAPNKPKDHSSLAINEVTVTDRRIRVVVATPHPRRWLDMYKHERQQAARAMRGKIRSPGRPSTARRQDRVEFWRAIGRGLPSDDAAAVVGMSSAFGAHSFREAGGMAPLKLVSVSGRYLSFEEREEIAILHAQRHGVREIARRVGRSPSTIPRELRRNASTRTSELEYRAGTAHWHAERRASRPKVAKLAANDRLRDYVQDRLAGKIGRPGGTVVSGPEVAFIGRRHGRRVDRRWSKAWSPEQISNRLRVDFPDDESMRISHEAI